MEQKKLKVLYVDDEPHNLTAFKATFRRDYDVYVGESAKEGRKILSENDIEIIITDQRMPEETGIEFLESIIPIYPDPVRILLTGYADLQAVIDAINKGQVYRYVSKPWNDEELKGIIKAAYELYSLRRDNKELTKSLLRANEQLEFMLRQKLLS